MASLPIASIDVGSNTIRLLIGLNSRGRLVRTSSDRVVTRLGKDLLKTGCLHKESVRLSIRALKKFRKECDKLEVQKIYAVGTSALRESCNTKEFLDAVKAETGLSIRIISGRREAELTLKGILQSAKRKLQNVLIVDIGGGSTEWILTNENAKCKVQNAKCKMKNGR